jgi:predicted nucleic acid-binding protein
MRVVIDAGVLRSGLIRPAGMKQQPQIYKHRLLTRILWGWGIEEARR